LQEKPVRAVEPRPRRQPIPEPTDEVGASRPTFDLSRRSNRDSSDAVRRQEEKWQAAIRDHDVKTLDELLARDFVGTSSTGKVGSKQTLLDALGRDKNDYKSVEARGMSVRTHGDDVAVVTGVTKESGTTKDGKRFKTSRRFTDTWVKRNGEWRCIASQTTELSKE
jgi:uncharacterized protein (TIGR02246 family)